MNHHNQDNNYKKCAKKIHEIELLKQKQLKQKLTKEENNKVSMKYYYTHLLKEIKESNKTSIHSLPYELLLIILSFIPANTRLAILKRKYPYSFFKNKLNNLPSNNLHILQQLYACATSVKSLLNNILEENDGIIENISLRSIEFANNPTISQRHYLMFDDHFTTLSNRDNKSKEIMRYQNYYKSGFINIILASIRHYTKLYKQEIDQTLYQKYEKIMLKLYTSIITLL